MLFMLSPKHFQLQALTSLKHTNLYHKVQLHLSFDLVHKGNKFVQFYCNMHEKKRILEDFRERLKEGRINMTFMEQPCSDSTFRLTQRFPRASAQTAQLLCMATVEQNGISLDRGQENQCEEGILNKVEWRFRGKTTGKESGEVMEEKMGRSKKKEKKMT